MCCGARSQTETQRGAAPSLSTRGRTLSLVTHYRLQERILRRKRCDPRTGAVRKEVEQLRLPYLHSRATLPGNDLDLAFEWPKGARADKARHDEFPFPPDPKVQGSGIIGHEVDRERATLNTN